MMELFNLTDTDATKIVLRLEPRVFFLWNESKRLEFSFEKSGTESHIFAIFIGKESESFTLSIVQHHVKPDTRSRLTVLSIMDGNSKFSYDGLIRIEKEAVQTDASQENKNLLLSENARASASPQLEILADDVVARHASATGSINNDAIFFAETHSIAPKEAQRLLAEGAVRNFFDEMRKLTDDPAVDIFEQESLEKLTLYRGRASLAKRKKSTEGRASS